MNQPENPKRLLRSRDDRYVGGVAAGLARYLSIDPTLVRVAFVVSLAFGGLGILAYIVLLALMPIEGPDDEPLPAISKRRSNLMIAGAVLTGAIVLVGVGSGGFGRWIFGFGPGPLFGILLWSAALIGIVWLGITMLSRDENGGTRQPGTPGTVVPSPTQNAPGPASEAAADEGDPDEVGPEPAGAYPDRPDRPRGEQPTGVLADEPTDVMPATRLAGGPGRAPESHAAGTGSPVTQRRNGLGATVGKVMVVIAAGIAALTVLTSLFVFAAWVTAQFGSVPMALVITVLGGAMILAAVQGRRRLAVGLLACALSVAVPMAVVTLADLRIDGSYGAVEEVPTRVSGIPADGYSLAAGRMVVDLRKLPFGPDTDLPLRVRSGFGMTSIVVPDRVCVTTRLKGGAGLADIRGRESSGPDITHEISAPRRATPQVRLDIDFKLGMVEVVDSTDWKNGGSFDSEDPTAGGRTIADPSAARARGDSACIARPAPHRSGKKGN